MYDGGVRTPTRYISGPCFLLRQSDGHIGSRLSYTVRVVPRPEFTDRTDNIGSKLEVPVMVRGDIFVVFFMIELEVCWRDDEQAKAEEKLGDRSRSKLMTAAYQRPGCAIRLIHKHVPGR
jgi:hypothetical protein